MNTSATIADPVGGSPFRLSMCCKSTPQVLRAPLAGLKTNLPISPRTVMNNAAIWMRCADEKP